ncbi:response regulator [Fulvivirga ligni]|uniref:response regulator n=1 Tax=Fulvivirga ligni TaxID=2904246 RepID=UPI001F44A43F|nr:response regulator [Fulvivirga ligni]UII19731.1 response regulator [Fulvivirga ligni]
MTEIKSSTKPLTVAICDDDTDTCELVKLIGGQIGVNVLTCFKLEDFNTAEADNEIDVVFMDVNWGKINGIQMARELKDNYKVYILSGAHNIEEITREEELNGYLEKPFSLKTIRTLLTNLAEEND